MVVEVATGEASGTKGGMAGMLAVVATAAVVAVNPEVVEVAVAAEEASWAEGITMASINLVALGTRDHVMILNRVILTTTPSLCKALVSTLQLRLWLMTPSTLVLLRQTRKQNSP